MIKINKKLQILKITLNNLYQKKKIMVFSNIYLRKRINLKFRKKIIRFR